MEPALIDKWKCFPHVMVHETARSMQMFIRDGVRGIFECGEQDQLEQYVMAKVWDDPNVNVDGCHRRVLHAVFWAAAEPMKRFYLRLEEIACDQANYPPPYYRRDGIDWRKAAWERLGTPERMEELGALISEAEKLATDDPAKQRVSLWRKALWEWMCQGEGAAATKPLAKAFEAETAIASSCVCRVRTTGVAAPQRPTGPTDPSTPASGHLRETGLAATRNATPAKSLVPAVRHEHEGIRLAGDPEHKGALCVECGVCVLAQTRIAQLTPGSPYGLRHGRVRRVRVPARASGGDQVVFAAASKYGVRFEALRPANTLMNFPLCLSQSSDSCEM